MTKLLIADTMKTIARISGIDEVKACIKRGNSVVRNFDGVDWLGCRDGKWRPVRPGSFPLVDGAPARVGRLRGYGNAINAEQAKIWIETVMDALGWDITD